MGIANLLQELTDREGYRLGEAWRLNEKSLLVVVPVVKERPFGDRDYLTVEEAKETLELKDSGSISGIKARNKGDKPVFVRVGTIFGGVGTQSRGAEKSTVLEPDRSEEILVKCVHASHPISTHASFNVAASSSPMDTSFLHRSSQHQVWARVGHTYGLYASARAGSSYSALAQDNLTATLSSVATARKDIDELVSKIPVELGGQVGLCVIDLDGVKDFEAFDHPDSWTAVSKSVARKYAPELDRPGKLVFDLKKEALEETVTEFLKSLVVIDTASAKVEKGAGFAVKTLSQGDIAAEYTELAGKGIHLIAARREKEIGPHYGAFVSQSYAPPPESRSFTTGTLTAAEHWSRSNFERRKASRFLSRSLMDNRPAAWSQIARRIEEQGGNANPRTLASTLRAGVKEGYIQKRENGKKRYTLTARGRTLVENQPTS